MTNAQMKLLNVLPMDKWIKHRDIAGVRASSATIRALVSTNKLVAINVAQPDSITDEDVEKGMVQAILRPFAEGDFYPHFVKKIAEGPISYAAMGKISELEDKIRRLEERLSPNSTNHQEP